MSTALISSRGTQHPRRWTPAQLGTLSLWLDADDATSITGTVDSAVLVSEWRDKSGNGRNVSQSTGANQPTLVANAQNGRAVLRFDGTNHELVTGDHLDLRTGGISIVGAFRNNADGILIAKTSASTNIAGEWVMGTSAFSIYLASTFVSTALSPATNATKITALTLDRSTGTTLMVNGTQADADTGAPFPNTDDLNYFAALRVGGRDNITTSRMNGDIFEIVLSLATWTTDERQRVEGYLAHKWGLAASLPSDHPYRNAAP